MKDYWFVAVLVCCMAGWGVGGVISAIRQPSAVIRVVLIFEAIVIVGMVACALIFSLNYLVAAGLFIFASNLLVGIGYLEGRDQNK